MVSFVGTQDCIHLREQVGEYVEHFDLGTVEDSYMISTTWLLLDFKLLKWMTSQAVRLT